MRPILIVIPVHNGFEFVKPCIESVLRNTDPQFPIWVIDDASTDQKTIEYINELPVRLTRNWWNLGFMHTMNNALARDDFKDHDILMLNSDTVVPPGWVERMQRALDVGRVSHLTLHDGGSPLLRVAGVCALSNNATLVSVPNSIENHLPAWLSVDDMDRIVNKTSDHVYPELPTLHGFCMLLSREAINELGSFDRTFGRGYGEEVEWSLRARSAGWKVLVCDDLYVWHKNHASYGKARNALAKRAEKIIVERYPDYPQEIADYFDRGPLRAHKMRIFDRLRPRPIDKKRIRVLYVLHNWEGFGGLEIYSQRLVEELDEEVEFMVLHPTRNETTDDAFVRVEGNGTLRVLLNKRLTECPVWVREFPLSNSSELVECWFEELLSGWLPDIVHFHHLAGLGTFDLPRIAKMHGCKVLLSLCDDFFVCPLFRLGGECKKPQCYPDAQCLQCLKDSDVLDIHEPSTDEEILNLLKERPYAIRNMGASCDRITSPSEYLKRTYEDTWGSRIELLPLGVPVDRVVNLYHPSDKLRVGWIGAGSIKKGFGTFCDAVRQLRDHNDIEWHVIAPVCDEVDVRGLSHVCFHGPFEERTLGTWLQTIDVAVVAAMQNEAYGSIVDEVVGYGCPVLIAEVPVLDGKRLANLKRGTCWNYDWGDSEMLAMLIKHCVAVRDAFAGFNRPHNPISMKSFTENAADFLCIYRELVPRIESMTLQIPEGTEIKGF